MLSNAVVLKETNEPIGCVGIMFGDGVHSADIQEGDAEIGYWIGVPYWGKGLIPKAVNRLLVRCFDELGIKEYGADIMTEIRNHAELWINAVSNITIQKKGKFIL